MPVDLGDNSGGERHHLEIIDAKQAGAQAIVDVVGVIGDIVGEGGGLRLQRSVAPQLQIEFFVETRRYRREYRFRGMARPGPVPPGQRTVMLDDALQRFPGQVQPVELGIAVLQRRHHPQRLRVVVEAAMVREAFVQRPLAGMAERRMAEIVRQRQCLGEVLVEAELPGQRAGNLRHFQRMGQPRAVMVALVEHEYLRLVLQATKGGGMDHPVAIAPERAAGPARRLRKQPATAGIGVAAIKRAGGSHSDRHDFLVLIHLILRDYALNYV